MPKLTPKERAQAIRELEGKLTSAIESTPRGITDDELRGAILKVSSEQNLIK